MIGLGLRLEEMGLQKEGLKENLAVGEEKKGRELRNGEDKVLTERESMVAMPTVVCWW